MTRGEGRGQKGKREGVESENEGKSSSMMMKK